MRKTRFVYQRRVAAPEKWGLLGFMGRSVSAEYVILGRKVFKCAY